MTRIALLAPGSSVHTVRWANALAKRGLQVHLITAHAISESLSPAVRRHKLAVRGRPGYFLNLLQLRRCLARIAPDILHTHFASGYGTLGRLSRYRPQVLSVWGSDVYTFPNNSRLGRRLLTANLRNADWVCSTSHVMASQVRRLCPGVRGLSMTPFGIDPEHFSPRPDVSDPGVITVGTVKALDPMYGIDTLVRGFARCRQMLFVQRSETAGRLKLRIVGDGPQREELQRLARQLHVSHVTEFAGKVRHAEVPDQLNQLDIYVAASRSESFGVAVVEAASCALPVVVSNVGGLPEVVVDGKTGLVVPAEDPQALASALFRLAENPALRRQLGSAGRRRVMEEYEWNENVSRMLDVYQQVLDQATTNRRTRIPDPVLRDEQSVKYFDDHLPEYSRQRSKPIEDVVNRFADENSSLVDIGAGTGNLLKEIKNHTPVRKLFAVDVSEKSLRKCRQRVDCDVYVGSICDEQIAERVGGDFQFAVVSAVLHHLIGPTRRESRRFAKQAVENSLQLVRDGGYVIILEPVFQPALLMTAVFWLKKFVAKFSSKRVGIFGYWNNIGAPVVSYFTHRQLLEMLESIEGCEIFRVDVQKHKVSRLMRMAGIWRRAECYVVLKKTARTSTAHRREAA